jgi:hypothetical protein
MKKIAYILVLIFLSECCFSQENNTTKITIFQPGGVKAEDVPKPPPNTNLIKWNYSMLSRGVFLMNYEFVLTDKLTGEAGVGLTYRDFIYETMKNESLLEYRNPKVNFALEAALRFYPKKHDGFEGIYLSPAISYRKYAFDKQVELYGNGNYAGYSSTFYPGYSFVDLQFKFGYQYESWWVDDMITDFYIGFGYRSATSKYYELSTVNGGYSSSTIITPVTKSESYPQPLFGFKLGVAF